MTEIKLVDRTEQATAGIRATVPMSELTEFFGRAFAETMRVLRAQGVQPSGPPFGKYYGMPTDIVDVEAGFPVAAAVTAAGEVIPGSLPAGRVVEALHVGPYDTMTETYALIEQCLAARGLKTGDVMWETYLSDPETEPDPAGWRTLITCPLA